MKKNSKQSVDYGNSQLTTRGITQQDVMDYVYRLIEEGGNSRLNVVDLLLTYNNDYSPSDYDEWLALYLLCVAKAVDGRGMQFIEDNNIIEAAVDVITLFMDHHAHLPTAVNIALRHWNNDTHSAILKHLYIILVRNSRL